MKHLSVICLFSLCIFLSACATPPKPVVRTILDMPYGMTQKKVVIVSDAAKQYGRTFEQAFMENIRSLSQSSRRDLAVMRYVEFVQSPYNVPEQKRAFGDIVFVFVMDRGLSMSGYGEAIVTYLIEVKQLDREAFMWHEIMLPYAAFCSKTEQGGEFARVLFEQLHSRNIL